ncbi:MAG TPA: hypothetical protein VMB83_06325 [Roseiarcus sp.]|nr:hypothetical protein [Roseiarcus sp.]
MKSFSIAVALTVAAILVVVSTPTSAQDVDWKKGKLGYLVRLIGTYNSDALLDDPQVKQAMRLVVGKDVGLLKENLAARGPIDFIDGNLVLAGQAPHMGGTEEAALWVKVYDGSARAVIMHQGKVTIYAKELQYYHLPVQFRSYVRNLLDPNYGEELPPGIHWQK